MVERQVWEDFLAWLDEGGMEAERLRPFQEAFRTPLLEVVTTLKEGIPRHLWPANPKAYVSGNRISYVVDFGLPGTTPFCFTFSVDDGEWHLVHVEAIWIHIDVPLLPASTFPDLPEETKAFMREELAVTEQVRLFSFLSKERGREFALGWFRNGAGYFLAARAWVPFVPPHQAFILYACWEQQRLRGGQVVLETLSDGQAIIRLKPMFLEVYRRAMHLRQQVSPEDYRAMFESIWMDRAHAAGWEVSISYEDDSGDGSSWSVLAFTPRRAGPMPSSAS